MKTYTVTQSFTITNQQQVIDVGTVITRFDDSTIVEIDGVYYNSGSFWNWVGSLSSLGLMELTSSGEADPSDPLNLEVIDPLTNYKTQDIVNLLNNVVNYIKS